MRTTGSLGVNPQGGWYKFCTILGGKKKVFHKTTPENEFPGTFLAQQYENPKIATENWAEAVQKGRKIGSF